MATTTAATTASPGSGLELDQPVLVTGIDGVFQIGTDGTITGLLDGPVSVAVDDARGGLLYQLESGRSREPDDRSTIVWWIPKGAGGAQELLVPAPSSGHLLTLHDTYATPSGFAVLYTRHETTQPVDEMVDSLRRFNVPDRQVTELYSQGAIGQGFGDASAGGALISGTWYGEVGSECFLLELDGRRVDLVQPAAGDPAADEYVGGCALSPKGTRLAFVTTPPERVTVSLRHLETGEQTEFEILEGDARVGAIDLSDRTLLVNLEREGPLSAIVFDLDAPDVSPRRLPIAGVARFTSQPLDIGRQAASPTTSPAPTSSTTTSTSAPTSAPTTPPARCSAADVPIPPAQDHLPGPVADLRAEILLAATACDFDRLNELAVAGDIPFIHTDVLVEEYQNMAPGEFWRNGETRGVEFLAGLVHDLSQPVEMAEDDRLGVLYEWRDPALCHVLDDMQLCRWVVITEAADWIAFYSETP